MREINLGLEIACVLNGVLERSQGQGGQRLRRECLEGQTEVVKGWVLGAGLGNICSTEHGSHNLPKASYISVSSPKGPLNP